MIPSPKKIIILLVSFLFLFALVQTILFIALFHNKPKITQKNPPTQITNTQVMPIARSYTLSLPTSWHIQQNTNPSDVTKHYIFTVDNQQYIFQSFPLGSISFDNKGADSVTDEAVLINGRRFLIRTYMKQQQPVVILAISNESDLVIGGFLMQLPLTNTQTYINEFHHILATVQFATPAPITPLPPLMSSGTYQLPSQ